MNKLTRRDALKFASGVAFISVLPMSKALANTGEVDERIAKFTGGKSAGSGGIDIDLPEIAENGNVVPLTVNVDSPMTEADHVQSVMILAAGNPRAGVATFNFTPMSGKAEASTRMRLAGTQDVIAVAKMSDGSFRQIGKTVKVTIGGCGG